MRALERALALWRGPAFDEFAHEEWAAGGAARLNELHAAAIEDRVEGLVEAGRCSEAIAELSDHIAHHPLRDRPRGLLMRALAGDGRQADALRTLRDYRHLLAEEVGTEPSEAVQLIGRRIAGGWTGTSADADGGVERHGGLPTPLVMARCGPFVGRAETVDELDDAWRVGAWRVLIVAGEPGIGKTRLLAELAHRMHGAGRHVVVARGDEDYAVTYRPWTDLLDPIVESMTATELGALHPDQLGALAQVVPHLPLPLGASIDRPGSDADARRALLLDAVLAVLRIAGPTVLVVDDLQWIDAASIGILRRVAAAAIPDLTILAAYRDTDVVAVDPLAAMLADLRSDDGVRRLVLDGIDGAAVVELVVRSSGRPLDAATISLGHAIHARTAGNPLFAGELITHLGEQTPSVAADDRVSPVREVPAGLVEIIGRRLARLGEAVDVLRVAAAVGLRFDVRVVEATVGLDRERRQPDGGTTDVLVLLERARDAGLVVDDDDGMSFRHAVIRSALLDAMSTARRQRLHRDIATVLERMWASSVDRHLEALAYHHDRGRSVDAPRWYQRAAAAAASELDASAADLSDRGLELLATSEQPNPELRCDLLISRVIGLRLAGRETVGDARRATDAAIALGDPERIAAALLSLSVRGMDLEAPEHVAFLTDGLAHLTDVGQASRWHVAAELAIRTVSMPSGNAAALRRDLLDVIAHLDPESVTSCQLAMRCARNLTSTSQAAVAASIVARFAPNCDGLDSEGLPVELGLATMWLHLGNRDSFDRNLELAAHDPLRRHWLFDSQVRQREVLRDLLDGRWSNAAAGIAEVHQRAVQDPSIIFGCMAQQGWLQRETGAAERTYQQTLALATGRPEIPLVQSVLASDAAEAGWFDVARGQLDRLAADEYVGSGAAWMTVMALGNLAWAAVTVDARDHARDLRRLLEPYAGQLAVIGTGVYVLGAIDRLLAGLAALEGDDEAAEALFAAAIDLERAVCSRPLEARTAHWWGRARKRRGDGEGARAMLTQAATLADELEMKGLVAQLDAMG